MEFADVIGDDEAQTPFELLRDKNLLGEVDGLLEALDPARKKSFRSALAGRWKAEDAGRWLVRTLALRESVFANYRTLHWPSSAARLARERTLPTKQREWQPNKRE
jgi:hypothetical protein